MDFSKLGLLFNLVVSIEFITFFAAILLLHQSRIGRWRLFIPMLFVIVTAETLGWYYRFFLFKHNAWIFNVNMILTITFLLWLLSTGVFLIRIRKIILGLACTFVMSAIANLFFFQGMLQYNQYSEMIGDVIQVIVCCLILYHFIREDIYDDLLKNEYFWLTNGVLFSAMGSAFLYMVPTVFSNFQNHTGINIFGLLNGILNFLLYGSMITAFLCRNRNMKLSREL